jgi:hypothetical protein
MSHLAANGGGPTPSLAESGPRLSLMAAEAMFDNSARADDPCKKQHRLDHAGDARRARISDGRLERDRCSNGYSKRRAQTS